MIVRAQDFCRTLMKAAAGYTAFQCFRSPTSQMTSYEPSRKVGEKTLTRSCLLGLLLFSLLCVTAPTRAQQQQWREVKPNGAGFRVEFPAAPKTEWRDMPSGSGMVPALISLLSRDDGIDFMMMYSNFPSGTFSADSQAEFDILRNNSVRDVRGKLRSETQLNVGGAPARRIVVGFYEGNSIATVLFVLNGTRVYQVICIAPSGRENDSDILRFMSSFALVPH